MDGIDGLACFQCLISCIGTILLGDAAGISNTHWSMILATTLAGAALGFLPFNFPRSKMFMGDVGSAPIGLLLAIIGVDLSSQVQGVMLLSIFLLHANFILDTSINLIRRMLRGEKWHEAHRSHFYQKLQQSKRSHVFVTLFEVVIQLVTLILAILLLKTNSIWSLVFFAVGIALWLGFFVYCERSLPNSVGKVNRLQKS
jgi:Fuc2NAc and GlcNAc transferase